MTETQYTDTQLRVLEAALNRLQAAEVEWSKGLTFDQLSADSGIDRSDIAKAFGSKERLIAELVDYSLTPRDARYALEEIDAAVETLLAGGSLRAALSAIGNADDEYHQADNMLVAQMAIWSLGRSDKNALTKLAELYDYFDTGHREVFDALLEQLGAKNIAMVEGITPDEFVAILSAVAEGTAIRRQAEPRLASEHLTVKAFLLLFEAVLRTPSEPPTLGEKLDSISP